MIEKILAVFVVISMLTTTLSAAALSSNNITEGQLQTDPVNDVVEGSGDGVKEIVNEVDEVTDTVDEVDEVTDTVDEGVEEVQDNTFDIIEEVEDEGGEDLLPSSAIDEVGDITERVVDDVGDGAFELVEEVEDEAEVVVDDTLDITSSSVKEVTGLVGELGEENTREDSEDNVADIAEELIEDEVDEVVEQVFDLKIIQNPVLTVEEIGEIINEALDVQGLNEWSSDGWEFATMDFIGKIKHDGDKAEWESAIVHLHLPEGAGDPPEECFQGWSATVEIDLETGEAEDSSFPTEEDHECTSDIVLAAPDSATKPSFVFAEADDVTSNDVYGNIAYLKTPSYNQEIFDHMDRYIAHLLNQKWKTSPTQYMTQVGWLISTIEGCAGCGDKYISANSSAVVFTDTSVFGNLEAHKIPFEWKPDEEMLAETICSDDEHYIISVMYDGQIFNHNTKIPCENADNDSKTSNSVFFENWNTVESSLWAQDITGKVEAHSAHEFMHSTQNLTPWISSTNEEQACNGNRGPTEVIEGSLASKNVATWSDLSKVPPAC